MASPGKAYISPSHVPNLLSTGARGPGAPAIGPTERGEAGAYGQSPDGPELVEIYEDICKLRRYSDSVDFRCAARGLDRADP